MKVIQDFKLVCMTSAESLLDFILVCRPLARYYACHGALAKMSVNYTTVLTFSSNFSCKNNMYTRSVLKGVLS